MKIILNFYFTYVFNNRKHFKKKLNISILLTNKDIALKCCTSLIKVSLECSCQIERQPSVLVKCLLIIPLTVRIKSTTIQQTTMS